MKKTIALISVLLFAPILFAAQECPGKQVPFSLVNNNGGAAKSFDVNADGVPEKFFMCQSSKEKNKTLFRILDGKTNEIIASVILDINPTNLEDEAADISLVQSLHLDERADSWYQIYASPDFKKAFSYLAVDFSAGVLSDVRHSHNLFFQKGKFIGMIKTKDNSGGGERSNFDYEKIIPVKFPKYKDIPALAVYGVKQSLVNPFDGFYTNFSEKLLRLYVLENGMLKQIYKTGDSEDSLTDLYSSDDAD